MDVWGWAAVALFLGPVLAALAIPILKWLSDEPRRFVVLFVVLALVYWKVNRKPVPSPTPRAGTPRSHVQ